MKEEIPYYKVLPYGCKAEMKKSEKGKKKNMMKMGQYS